MQDVGIGQAYKVSVDNIQIPLTPTPSDLFQLAPASNVPIIVDRITATANVLSGAVLRLVLRLMSAASTGGTSVVPQKTSLAGPSASTVVTYLTSTIGTPNAGSTPYDSQQWNEFAPYEWNVRPSGIVIPPTYALCLYMPAAPGSATYASFTAEFVEIK